MSKWSYLILLLTYCPLTGQKAEPTFTEDSDARADLEAMVETMGGEKIWSQLKSVHFKHRWYFSNRESYIENEILDLTGARSWVEMKNETYHRIRAYSPENKYWNIVNGEFAYAKESSFEVAMQVAPFEICRITRAIARKDPNYKVIYGKEEFRGTKRIEIYGKDDKLGGYLVLNFKKEPIVWATTRYKYNFGPMKRFGNLRFPKWAMTANGAVTYDMISLEGDNRTPESKLFVPPIKETISE